MKRAIAVIGMFFCHLAAGHAANVAFEVQELTGEKGWKCDAESRKWLGETIERIQTIEVGATRRSLEMLFKPSGETGNRFRQRFDYLQHAEDIALYVEVEFDRDPAKLPLHPDADRISTISVPFIGVVPQTQQPTAPATWVDEAVQRMLAIKPGMTRKRLLQDFRGGGGIYNDIEQGFVSRDCPLFRVHVTFEPVGRPARDAQGRVTMNASEEDRIVRISRPHLTYDPAD